MKKRCLFLVFIILAAVTGAAAQAKTITNADLTKYQQERINAEAEYRENYARLGFPSPEELERRREQSRIETEQLSAKLRAERLMSERIEAEQRTNERLAAAYYRSLQAEREPQYSAPLYFWSYGRRLRFPTRQHYVQPGYFAGGQFWPTGPRTRPQPMWVRPRR